LHSAAFADAVVEQPDVAAVVPAVAVELSVVLPVAADVFAVAEHLVAADVAVVVELPDVVAGLSVAAAVESPAVADVAAELSALVAVKLPFAADVVEHPVVAVFRYYWQESPSAAVADAVVEHLVAADVAVVVPAVAFHYYWQGSHSVVGLLRFFPKVASHPSDS